MRVVFLGTDRFAIPTLEFLFKAPDHEVVGVVTGPDKPAGRGRKLQPTPVKQYLLEQGPKVPVLTPDKLKNPDFHREFRELEPDAAVVVAFRILPPQVFDAPKYGTLNVHPSLLPKYRGPAPINWALINGDDVTGVSVIRITQKVDAGGVLVQQEQPIFPHETAGELAARLSVVGGEMVPEALRGLRDGTLKPIPQNESLATKAPKLSKEDGLIDWSQTALTIHNRVRGVTPWPGAFTYFDGKTLKIYDTRPLEQTGESNEQSNTPGTVLKADQKTNRLVVACAGDTALAVHEVQLQGKKRMPVGDFLRGVSLTTGDILG